MYRRKTLFKNLFVGLTVAALSLFGGVEAAQAGNSYGYGQNYFEICNESDISVAYMTDETSGTLSVNPGDCDVIWTDWDYIVVDYDESDAPGWQNYTAYLNYPDDLSFYTWEEGYYTVIDHYTW